MNFDNLFQQIAGLKIAVVGDAMLDTYWWGKVERISPEAPVPVVAVSKREQRMGGAANVAMNLKALGTNVHLLSVIGDDKDGDQLLELASRDNIQTDFVVRSAERVTTNKIRIISRNQQMMRLDAEMEMDLTKEEEREFLTAFEKFISQIAPDAVILEDYNKGVFTPAVIEKIISICRRQGIVTSVDPKRKNFFAYKGVDIFKPNLKEVKEAFNILKDIYDKESLQHIHYLLNEKIQHNVSFITLSEKGVFFQSPQEGNIIPTHVRTIADVSGAGDTVIAIATAVYTVTKDVCLMAAVANIAGGLVCEEVGTAAVEREKLLAECKKLLN